MLSNLVSSSTVLADFSESHKEDQQSVLGFDLSFGCVICIYLPHFCLIWDGFCPAIFLVHFLLSSFSAWEGDSLMIMPSWTPQAQGCWPPKGLLWLLKKEIHSQSFCNEMHPCSIKYTKGFQPLHTRPTWLGLVWPLAHSSWRWYYHVSDDWIHPLYYSSLLVLALC